MAVYFILQFHPRDKQDAVLKKWLIQEGKETGPDMPLLSYEDGGGERRYCPPVVGVYKVHLFKEGDTMSDGSEIAVLSLDESVAQKAVKDGHGKILTPEELDETLAHAGAASIRQPD